MMLGCSWTAFLFLPYFGFRTSVSVLRFPYFGFRTSVSVLRFHTSAFSTCPNQKQAQPESFLMSDVGLVKGEILALVICICMRVGKGRPPT